MMILEVLALLIWGWPLVGLLYLKFKSEEAED